MFAEQTMVPFLRRGAEEGSDVTAPLLVSSHLLHLPPLLSPFLLLSPPSLLLDSFPCFLFVSCFLFFLLTFLLFSPCLRPFPLIPLVIFSLISFSPLVSSLVFFPLRLLPLLSFISILVSSLVSFSSLWPSFPLLCLLPCLLSLSPL